MQIDTQIILFCTLNIEIIGRQPAVLSPLMSDLYQTLSSSQENCQRAPSKPIKLYENIDIQNYNCLFNILLIVRSRGKVIKYKKKTCVVQDKTQLSGFCDHVSVTVHSLLSVTYVKSTYESFQNYVICIRCSYSQISCHRVQYSALLRVLACRYTLESSVSSFHLTKVFLSLYSLLLLDKNEPFTPDFHG